MPSSNPTPSAAKQHVSHGKTRVWGRLWRLTGRLTRGQGSALDDAAPASMHVHGRAGKPKQLARHAKNPGKTRVLQRRGQEPNFLMFSQCLPTRPPFPSSRIMLLISISLPITKFPPEQRVDQDRMIRLRAYFASLGGSLC